MVLYKYAAEQKLRASERRFAATLSSIGDAVIATDAQARVTFMNSVAEAPTGWLQREAAGRPLPDVFRIVNENTREIVEDPGAKVLRLITGNMGAGTVQNNRLPSKGTYAPARPDN